MVKVKDPNKPKRPPSSFFLFMEEFKKTYKKHPFLKIQNTAVSRLSIEASERWKCMLKSEKAPYIAKAEEMMAEYKKKMQAYNGGGVQESRLEELLEIDEEEEEEEEEENLPPSSSSPTTEAAAAQESDLDLGQLVADRFLKFRDAIIKDYLASKTFEKELDDHLEKYKKSEKYKQELAAHLENYKASKEHKDIAVQEVVGSFIQGLPAAQGRIYDLLRNHFPDLDIASCGFPAETASSSYSSQRSRSSSSSSSVVNEIKFLLLLLPFLLPLLLRPTDEEDDLDTVSLKELITKKMT